MEKPCDKDYYVRRLRVLRILIAVIVISILVLLSSCLWLVYLHVKLRSDIIDGYQEFSCLKTDEICLGLLCPTGITMIAFFTIIPFLYLSLFQGPFGVTVTVNVCTRLIMSVASMTRTFSFAPRTSHLRLVSRWPLTGSC